MSRMAHDTWSTSGPWIIWSMDDLPWMDHEPLMVSIGAPAFDVHGGGCWSANSSWMLHWSSMDAALVFMDAALVVGCRGGSRYVEE